MRIPDAPRHRRGYLQARPGDVIGRDDLVIVDVRREEDLTSDLGHIHGVLHVPKETMLREGLVGVSPATPVVVVCDNGRQSEPCAAYLVRQRGFGEVYHLVGGMVRWNAEERPVAKVRTWRSPLSGSHDGP